MEEATALLEEARRVYLAALREAGAELESPPEEDGDESDTTEWHKKVLAVQ